MRKSKSISGSNSPATLNFHADRFMLVQPKILSEYKKSGVRYFRVEGNKTYVAELYLKTFGKEIFA